MDKVIITRLCEYAEVFTDQVRVPGNLMPGLEWIQIHCPLNTPTTVRVADLSEAWDVPATVIRLGLHTLQQTGFFSLEDVDK